MEFRSRLVTAQVQAACRPFFCKNKIGNSWLTNAAFHGILIDVDGALAQLVAHNTGSVGVRSSNLLCSTKFMKSELIYRWVRISFFIVHQEQTPLHTHRILRNNAQPIQKFALRIAAESKFFMQLLLQKSIYAIPFTYEKAIQPSANITF